MTIAKVEPRPWRAAIVAATGPSLTPEVADVCRQLQAPDVGVIAVNDAYRLLPFADVLFACDARWWDVHGGVPDFAGERWSSHGAGANDKIATAKRYDLDLVAGAQRPGFSFDPVLVHYGYNSGFQAVNLALLFSVRRIALVGFDMRESGGKVHFFGDHPPPLRNGGGFARFIEAFDEAARLLPADVKIFNATPGSALTGFPFVPAVDERWLKAVLMLFTDFTSPRRATCL